MAAVTAAELMARHPAPVPRTLADLPEWERVWTASVELRATAHRKASGLTAVCGAWLLEWPVAAGHLAVLHGRLCPQCWPTNETPDGIVPPGEEE